MPILHEFVCYLAILLDSVHCFVDKEGFCRRGLLQSCLHNKTYSERWTCRPAEEEFIKIPAIGSRFWLLVSHLLPLKPIKLSQCSD